MKKIELDQTREFNPLGVKNIVVHDSEFFKIINFNIKAGMIFPVHSHDIEGQLSIVVIEGDGQFLGDNDATIDAKVGDMLVCDISEPHGVKANSDMRILVTIAPPI